MADPRTYERAWERATSLLERRQSASSLGLGVNTALLAAMAFVMRGDGLALAQRLGIIIILMAAGVVACVQWARTLRSYQLLMRWWYGKLQELEEAMPAEDRLATAEYAGLYAKPEGHERLSLTRNELALIKVIGALHVLFLALAAVMYAEVL
ncbi:MAG: hypothetical protein R3A79_00195 [Nannocystaceae bacterium]